LSNMRSVDLNPNKRPSRVSAAAGSLFQGNISVRAARMFRRPLRRLLLLANLILLCSLPLVAAELKVMNTDDSGTEALRARIEMSSPGDTITFDASVAGKTIFLDSELTVSHSLTISGLGSLPAVTLASKGSNRILRIAAGTVAISNLTFRDGKGGGAGESGSGGAIFNLGTLTLNRCTILDSTALNRGGGVFSGVGSSCTVQETSITRCFASNSGGAIAAAGVINLTASAFYDNTATRKGGALATESQSDLTVKNCTLAGNTTSEDGGAIHASGSSSIQHSTLSANTAGRDGGAIYNAGQAAVRLDSSIVAGNSALAYANIAGTTSGPDNNITDREPLLLPLGNYGGRTFTMRPRLTSPAIDAGGSSSLATDQRGFPRLLGLKTDVGACELEFSDLNPDSITIRDRVPVGGSDQFEISEDPDFLKVVRRYAGGRPDGKNDGFRLDAGFSEICSVAGDGSGNLFVADVGNNKIRMIATDGTVTTIAGNGEFGAIDGAGINARFGLPLGVATDSAGNVYVADTFNHRIRKLAKPLTPDLPWAVTTLAGSTSGLRDGAGSSAKFSFPSALTVDANGVIYVADSQNHCIRQINSSGAVSTFAGTGADASLKTSKHRLSVRLSSPRGVLAAAGVLYISDTGNNRVIKVDTATGTTSVVAGFSAELSGYQAGLDSTATFDSPCGLAMDRVGILYVAELKKHSVRSIQPDGKVSKVAGLDLPGSTDGNTNVAKFNEPAGVVVMNRAGADTLYIADSLNGSIRETRLTALKVDTASRVSGDASEIYTTLNLFDLRLDPYVNYYFRRVGSTDYVQSFSFAELPDATTLDADRLTPISGRMRAAVHPHTSPTKVVYTYSTDPQLRPPMQVGTLLDGLGSGACSIAVAPDGGIYLADKAKHRIFKWTAANGLVPFAGTGVAGFSDGSAAVAAFECPSGIAVDAAGNVFVADTLNHRIRKISPQGVVSTFAGSGVAGLANGSRTESRFLFPEGVAVDAAGNVFVADTGNHCIRKITLSDNSVSTFAGSTLAGFADSSANTAKFSSPVALAVKASGDLIVADKNNNRVRLVTIDGNVVTLAGTGEASVLSSPSGVTYGNDGLPFIVDAGNRRVLRLSAEGILEPYAGSGVAVKTDSPGPAFLYPTTASGFLSPNAIAMGGADLFYVIDAGSIRKIARRSSVPRYEQTALVTGDSQVELGQMIPEELLQGATYYYRVTATNERGTRTGEILSFTTPWPGMVVHDGALVSAPELENGRLLPIDFGTLPKDRPAFRYFTVSNRTGVPFSVNEVRLPLGYQSASGGGIVPPGGSITFEVQALALGAGVFSGNIEILTNAILQNSFIIPVTCLVLEPPRISSLAVSIVSGGASLSAKVNPLGSPTDVWFEWSLDPDFKGVVVNRLAGSTEGMADGNAANARFRRPLGMVVDTAGNIYVADSFNHCIRKVTKAGVVSTLAGSGESGFAEGQGTAARFDTPLGLVIRKDGMLLVADSGNHRIRAVAPDGSVSTFSGLGLQGFTDGVAEAARFSSPAGLAIDGSGILYVADSGNNRIRTVSPSGLVSTLAGSGIAGAANGAGDAAQLSNPSSIAVDSNGYVYFLETGNHGVRQISPGGMVKAFAGSASVSGYLDAFGTQARFDNPSWLFADGNSIKVLDRGNQCIRSISADGEVTTCAGGQIRTTDSLGEPVTLAALCSAISLGNDVWLTSRDDDSSLDVISPSQQRVSAGTALTGDSDLSVSAVPSAIASGATVYFRVIAVSAGGTTISGSKTLMTPFQSWFSSGSDPGGSANPSPADVLRYAFGMSPGAPNPESSTSPAATADRIAIIYQESTTAPDVLTEVEWSSDLIHWSREGISYQVIAQANGVRTMSGSVPRSGTSAKFLRIKASLK
jgi:sugar lactone lactonase YvrE